MRRLKVRTVVLSLCLAVLQAPLLAAETLRVGFPSLATALSPTWVTLKKGFWKKNGLDVELIYLSGAITILSLRFLLDFIGRRYPKAKSVGETEYTDLSLLEEIQRSGFLEQISK